MPKTTPNSQVEETHAPCQSPAVVIANKRLFTSVELRLFRYTAILLSFASLITLTYIFIWAFGWLLGFFYNLLLPLSVAGILALVLYPVVQFLQCRLRLPKILAIALLMLVFFTLFFALLYFFVPTLVNQIVALITVLPEMLASWQASFTTHFTGLSDFIATRIETSEGEETDLALSLLPSLEDSSTTIASYLGLLAGFSFIPLLLFFALLSGDLIRGQVAELLSVFSRNTQQKSLYFIDVFVGYITAFFRGQLVIALCMAILYSLSFMMIGLKFGLLVGLILGLLNIVPFLGSLIGLMVVLPMAYLQPEGGLKLLVFAGIVFAAVQLIEGWLLTPKIMANQSGLHPALVVISLFFWGTVLGGIIGMVLAVPLTAFLVTIWREVKVSLEHALNNKES